MHIPKSTRTLETAKYSFDASRNAWFCGKKPIEEEEVLVHLIRYAKSQGKKDAGAWGADELERMKRAPELTTGAFVKRNIIRNRNNRIAGKYLFSAWCSSVGIAVVGKIEDFMVRNSLLVSRFYNEVAAVYGHFKKQARVLGCVMSSVFFGIDIRVFVDAVPPLPPKQPDSCEKRKNEALKRHMEFMTDIYVEPNIPSAA